MSDAAQVILSVTALVVSVVALAVSGLQLLQQYFSTAEGYRRCQAPVMGAWAVRTDAPFIKKELRYQTTFQTPHLTLENPARMGKNRHLIGSKDLPSDKHNLVETDEHYEKANITNKRAHLRASWLTFLEQLELYQTGVRGIFGRKKQVIQGEKPKDIEASAHLKDDLEGWFSEMKHDKDVEKEFLTLPAAEAIEYAWDFMPPEIVRPFASVALGDFLVMGHRLGLDWTAIDVRKSILQAQDDRGNSISSNDTRGLGILATFTHDEAFDKTGAGNGQFFRPQAQFVPNVQADKLAFGILPGDPDLDLDDVLVATDNDCLNYIESLSPRARAILEQGFNRGDITKTGFDHLLPIIAPCLALPECRTIRLRLPSKWCHVGPLQVMEGYIVFRERITEIKNGHLGSASRVESAEWILHQWHEDIRKNIQPFAPAHVVTSEDSSILSTTMSRVHHKCTQKLREWSDRLFQDMDEALKGLDQYKPARGLDGGRPMYELVRVHMLRAIELRDKARQHLDQKKPVRMFELEHVGWPDAPMFCQMMNALIDQADSIADEVITNLLGEERRRKLQNRERDQEVQKFLDCTASIWFIMVFRALIFNRSCIWVEPKRAGGIPSNLIPAKWHDSRIPIYLG